MTTTRSFDPDVSQAAVLDHGRGPLLVTGAPGTGKSRILRERFAILIEAGADPERVGLVVRSKHARTAARKGLLERLSRPMPEMRVLTVHGLAHQVMSARFAALGYRRPPEVLAALDHLARVRDLLSGEDPSDWPAYRSMLGLHGFTDEVRQFLTRAQEALLTPEDVEQRAVRASLSGFVEVARFYRRYLDVLHGQDQVDFAGLVNQAAEAVGHGGAPFDHLLVDDYQDATFAEERLVIGAAGHSLTVAGDPGSHIFSFQGTTDRPVKRFRELVPTAEHVELAVCHRSPAGPRLEAWAASHPSEEHRAAARELRRAHVEESVPWERLAVVLRRDNEHVGGILRALDDAGIPRTRPEGGLALLSEPATRPFVLALRWLARPGERDGSIESLLTSDLARLSPATARSLVRAAQTAGGTPAAALGRTEGLSPQERADVAALASTLQQAESVAARSVLDAFQVLWKGLPYSRRLVEAAESSAQARRDLDAVIAFSESVGRAGDRADASVSSFLEVLEGGAEAPGLAQTPDQPEGEMVRILTAHGSAGLEFDTVLVVGATEGNFPSLTRPEPMFDLAALEGPLSQSERNRLRVQDERRLFDVVASRAARRVLFLASDPYGEGSVLATRSRFVAQLGVKWAPAPSGPGGEPLSSAEAAATWRRGLADPTRTSGLRLAQLAGLLQLGDRPSRWWFQRDWSGTDRPLHEGIRVSYSKLSTLENCALQFVLSEELGLEGQAGYYAWVGHLVHSIIEECEKGEIERTEAALVTAAEDRWSPKEFPSHAVSEAFRRLVTRQMLPAWFASYGQTEALAGEQGFDFEFDGATVTGKIDRVSRAGKDGCQITDYKTGRSRSAPPSEDNLQLGIYFLALTRVPELAAFGAVKQVELAFLRETTGEGAMKRVMLGMNSTAQKEFGQKMEERLSSLIERIREFYRTEVYRPSPQAECRYCDFKSLCPLWPEGRELFPAPAKAAT